MEVISVCYDAWMYLARDRDWWRALVNMIMVLRGFVTEMNEDVCQ